METTSKRSLKDIAASAPPRLKEKLAELAMSEGIAGKRELLEGAALVIALKPHTEKERTESLSVLREIGTESLDEAFHNLLALGEVGFKSLDSYTQLRIELRPPQEDRPSGTYMKGTAVLEKFHSWKLLDDDQALERAQTIVTKNAVTNMAELQTKFRGAYVELHKRGLLGSIEYTRTIPTPLPKPSVPWNKMHDDEVLQRAQDAIARDGIQDLHGLGQKYRGISYEIIRRRLAEEIFFSNLA